MQMLKHIAHKIKELNPLQAFLLKAFLLFIVWEILYLGVIGRSGALDYLLTKHVGEASAQLMTVGGVPSSCEFVPTGTRYNAVHVTVEGKPSLLIADGCNGLTLMVLFAGFIIAAPGAWRKKLWFIPFGIAMIYTINLVRVIVLSFNYHLSPETFDFNHKYTYAIAVYGVIFLLWMWWMKKFTQSPPGYAS